MDNQRSKRQRLNPDSGGGETIICPKVFIITMFGLEADVWRKNPTSWLDLTARHVPLPGLSPKYPDIFCTLSGEVCQIVTAEGLINASLTISALVSSPLFDLTHTYFIISGISGVNPRYGSLGTVALAKYAIQVDMQYEFDAREIPASWPTGYVALGASAPGQYPAHLYGTEVFVLNEQLRDIAQGFAQRAVLLDAPSAAAYRRRYCTAWQRLYSASEDIQFTAALLPPSVISGDVASANVFFHGPLLSRAVEQYCQLMTRGRATYCMTAQEDNGTLAALARAAAVGTVDFARVVILRSGSNFDQPPPGGDFPLMPLHTTHGGLEIALDNVYLAALEVVKGILDGWDDRFLAGIAPESSLGDDLARHGNAPR
ncbi:purine nucleoside permease [Podospora didyma]|uniref:Purine nucleoside permease n=1 Tax=Podospora didyma TaxID=330526 RepID=A0AAE0U5F8_9PEZI|nr:purine nucleoside permease [Podospora didyma]